MRLADRVVVVTGSSGIAAAGARRFAAEGASVFVVSIDEGETRALSVELAAAGASSDWARADLTNESDCVAAFARCEERFGRLDGLFAVVGASGRRVGDGPADTMPLEGWKATIEVNTSPPFLASRQAIAMMRRRPESTGGSIVLVGSVLANHPSPLFVTHAYAAAKGAIISFARGLASYYAADRIRVNVISPGLVRTPMSSRASEDAATMAYVEAKQPLAGGMLEPEAIADAALFLLSDESWAVTGQVLEVDGGWGVTEAGH